MGRAPVWGKGTSFLGRARVHSCRKALSNGAGFSPRVATGRRKSSCVMKNFPARSFRDEICFSYLLPQPPRPLGVDLSSTAPLRLHSTALFVHDRPNHFALPG